MRSTSKKTMSHHRAMATWNALDDNIGFSFPASAAALLQEGLAGTVVLSTDPEYLAARQGFVPNLQEFPQLIVYCEVIRDVVRCLDFAREFGLWVACRSGGHSTAGYSVNTGMIIDLSRMDDVVVDPRGMRAVVAAGATFGKINAALDVYHLHIPGGGCADVGIGGYMQGGGYGATSLIYGMNCDNVESALLALYDGTLVRASATENADLFWAIRGGTGGNFGVLLEVTYVVHDLWEVWGFGITWTGADLPAALDALQTGYTGSAIPPNLGYQAIIGVTDGTAELIVLGLYNGSDEDGRAALAPLLALPGATLGPDQRGTYTDLNEALFGKDPSPQPRTLADSRYVTANLGVSGWKDIADFVATSPNDTNFVAFEPYGGRILETSPTECAFIHRNAGFDVFIWVFWMNVEEEARSMDFLDRFDTVLSAKGNGEAFQNYPRRSNEKFREMYWGAAYPTLQAVKAKYDPSNFFHFQQSITGAAPTPGEHLFVDVSGPIVPSPTVFRPPVVSYKPPATTAPPTGA